MNALAMAQTVDLQGEPVEDEQATAGARDQRRPESQERQPPTEGRLAASARRLEAPRSAGVAGIAFSLLFSAALLMLAQLPIFEANDEEVAEWFASGGDTAVVIGTLYLLPFAGVAFLWFLAVVRDQVGDREDHFFGTVFYGSGLLFVALLFVVSGVLGSIVVGVRYLEQPAPSAEVLDSIRAIGYTLLLTMASRAVALFMLATATIGLRFGVFPRWFAIVGYVIGFILLVVVAFWDTVIYVVPAWVAFVSLFILRDVRRRSAGAETTGATSMTGSDA